ncbi:MAG: hypothetical protein WA738_08855 [Candidatus Angelobacter sp.]
MKTFFAIAFLVLGTIAVAAAQDLPKWQVQQVKDAFLGTELTQFRLEGKYLAAPQDGSTVPALMLSCKAGAHGKYDGQLEDASLFVGKPTVDPRLLRRSKTRAARNETLITTQYRLDDGKVHTEHLSHSQDFKMISLELGGCRECLINNLFYGHEVSHKEDSSPQVRKVILNIPEYVGGNIVIQFDLPDVTEVAKACGVTYHK